MQKQKIDKDWFISKLESQQKSVRGMARHLGIDAGSASRMLSGKRKMRMDEANAIATFLAAPVSEVLRHAGVSIDLDGKPTGILLAATINEKGKLERLSDPKPLPQVVIDRAQDAIKRADGPVIAAQVRALSGPFQIWDDAIVLFEHTNDVDPSAIGALAICRTYDGEQVMARIENARKTGEARLVGADGKAKDVVLQTATPVIAIIP